MVIRFGGVMFLSRYWSQWRRSETGWVIQGWPKKNLQGLMIDRRRKDWETKECQKWMWWGSKNANVNKWVSVMQDIYTSFRIWWGVICRGVGKKKEYKLCVDDYIYFVVCSPNACIKCSQATYFSSKQSQTGTCLLRILVKSKGCDCDAWSAGKQRLWTWHEAQSIILKYDCWSEGWDV